MKLFGFGKKKEAEKKETVNTVFTRYYNNLLKLTKELPIATNAELELLPAMYVACDYATAVAKKDRMCVHKALLYEIHNINEEFDSVEFDKRTDVYGRVLRGEKPRAEWLMGSSEKWEEMPIMMIVVVFGDMIYNPSCAEDYNNAPMSLQGIDVMMKFCEGMKPIINEFVSLFKEIHDL